MASPIADAQPQVVQPHPVPQSWNVQAVSLGNGGKVVVVTISGPTGNYVCFIEPESAVQIAGHLRSAGKQALSGLILPPGAMS